MRKVFLLLLGFFPMLLLAQSNSKPNQKNNNNNSQTLIDKTNMKNIEVKQTAGRTALGDFAPEFAHLNDDVLFGEVWNRNNWHVHHATKGGGQMLICVGGEGWYQEWGKPARKLLPGDVVNIPANVKHWHGAAADSWFSHLAIEVAGENTSNEWLEPVSDEEYKKLK